MHIPLLDLTRELGPHSEAIMTQWRQLLARPQFLNGDQLRLEGYWLRILPSRLANYLIALVTGIPVHDCGCGLKVYRREVLTGLALPTGMHRFLPVILHVAAEAVAEVPVTDRARQSGQSHYGMRRLFAVLRDLLPVHCIRPGIQQTMPGVIIAVLIALASLCYFIRAEFLANSLGTFTGVAVAAGAVVYLALGYLRPSL